MSESKKRAGPVGIAGLVLAGIVWLAVQILGGDPATDTNSGSGQGAGSGDAAIERAFGDGRSGVMVASRGSVKVVLPDDDEGSRHQKFILTLGSGRTVLVSHNIDLAPRVPLAKGDTVEFSGQYEFSEKGGVVHWTHHDPAGRREGGWLRHDGRKYE